MNIDVFEKTAVFEHRFWLQILGDHARFIFNSLSPPKQQKSKERNPWIFLLRIEFNFTAIIAAVFVET